MVWVPYGSIAVQRVRTLQWSQLAPTSDRKISVVAATTPLAQGGVARFQAD
jgi:hypothetical protein